MKIAIVTHGFPPKETAGTEWHSYLLARELSKKHSVYVFSRGAGESYEEYAEEFDGIPVKRINTPMGQRAFLDTYIDDRVALSFSEFLEDSEPDVVHVQHCIGLGLSILEVAVEKRIPTILFLHDFYLMCHRVHLLKPDWQLCTGPKSQRHCQDCILSFDPSQTEVMAHELGLRRYRYVQRLLSRVDRIIVPSEFVKKSFEANYSTINNISVSPLGLDLEFTKDFQKKESKKLRFGYTGPIYPHKGVHILVEAFKSLEADNVELRLYGGGDAGYLETLKENASKSDVHFLGAYSHSELAKVLSEIDVLIMPSICHESFSFTIREAHAVGIPVIVSDVRAQSDAIVEGINGLHFKCGDVNDLKKKLLLLARTPHMIRRLSNNARKSTVRSIDTQAKELESLYKKSIRQAGTRGPVTEEPGFPSGRVLSNLLRYVRSLEKEHSDLLITRRDTEDATKATLLALYRARPDLRQAFPEVASGNYRKILAWATGVLSRKFEDSSYPTLAPCAPWLLSRKVEEYEREVESAHELLKEREREVDTLRNELSSSSQLISMKEIECNELKADLDRKVLDLKILEGKSQSFQDVIRRIYLSPAWSFVELYRSLLSRFAPPWTFRRRLVELATRQLARFSQLIRHQEPETVVSESSLLAERLHYQMWKEAAVRGLSRRAEPPSVRDMPVDVIIPVHNGYSVFRRCIESVLSHTAPPYRVLVMDDASSDPDLLSYLETLKAMKQVVVMRNPRNTGYVRTVNQALQNSKDDVILLNSDTVVTRNWLDKIYRCAYSDERIGSVSPLSNNATICSIPNFCESNRLPDGFDVDSFADLVDQSSLRLYPAIITNPGSCIYIKRKVINEIGVFDEAFSPAYEEENDFCIRAFKAGYFAVLDDATFIYHEGQSSYSEEASSLKRKHYELMERKNPGYHELAQSFIRENPLRNIQERIRSRIMHEYAKSRLRLLYVIHKSIYSGSPGGTEFHCLQLVQNLKEYLVCVLYPEGQNLILQEHSPLGVKEYTYPKPYSAQHCITDSATESLFRRILKEFSIKLVHIQHLLGLPLSLIEVAKKQGVPVVLSLNDFYYVCPQYMLLRDGKSYCGIPEDMNICDSCVHTQFGYHKGFQESYRRYCRELITAVDWIICASQAAVDIYRKVHDMPSDKIQVIPHGYTPPSDFKKTGSVDSAKIGFVGSITAPFKGRNLVMELLSLNSRPHIEWHFFGSHSDVRPFLTEQGVTPVGRLIIHGRYERELLPSLLRQEEIGLVVLPYVQPETFSLALSEVWSAGVPVVAPDMCALGERVRQNGGGWLYPYGSDARSVLELLYRIVDDKDEYYEKVRECEKIQVPTLLEYLGEYRALYKKIIRDSELENQKSKQGRSHPR